MKFSRLAGLIGLWILLTPHWIFAAALLPVGFARVEINPTGPVRLMGYASRHVEATNIQLAIHARAIALGAGADAAVLITADNCILPGAITAVIRQRLQAVAGVAPERIAISVSHTHNAPSLAGAAPNLFVEDIPPLEAGHIEAYTRLFTERLTEVALTALSNRQPARVAWGVGRVGFAGNRRTPGGPVDHAVPLLRVLSPEGVVRGVLLNYACHCTTLGDFNQTHPDWNGVCARELEAAWPGAVALVAIGCGADANPDPRGTLALVEAHGRELAREAGELVRQELTEIDTAPACRLDTIQLPFQPHFTRDQWVARSTNSGIVGYHARKWLARLDRGEVPPPTLPYPVQTWVFGDTLAMVFLGGEVVVDYSLRLKRELDPRRLWVNGYVNDVPCYIPSRRILREGGYEAESSLWYYDRPQQLAPGIEDLIVDTVRQQLPASFRAEPAVLQRPPPLAPEASRQQMRTRPGLRIDLVADDRLVQSPVAIDFGADGSLWVAEMRDYPEGLDGRGKPGGRIVRLWDLDGDGRFDRSEVWAEDVPYPTGLMAVGDGVIVGAAPDILWLHAESGAGDGGQGGAGSVRKPTRREVLFTGFATHNFQARVNGFRWGYDGWIYGAGGLFGGQIHGTRRNQSWDCSGRDFRFRPETGEFESLAGVSQQGRTRDDFGNWFGNDNSTLLAQFPFSDTYLQLNPYVAPPSPRIALARGPDSGRVYPRSRTLERFNDFDAANRLTSACSPEIYRATALGPEYYGNALVCEPVHNLVRRAVLEPEGPLFGAHRAPGEMRSEFLSSGDNWFRPVEVRTGPDGAVWVVDFYRFVVEHPRWIPAERLKDLDPRAGAERGRIYRIAATNSPPGKLPDLRHATTPELAAALAADSGVLRDLADREVRSRLHAEPRGNQPVPGISLAAVASTLPPLSAAARVQWEWLRRLESAPAPGATLAPLELKDPDPRVRRALLPLMERLELASPVGVREFAALADDPDVAVRFQWALSLGRRQALAPDSEFVRDMLLRLVGPGLTNQWLRTAVLAAAGTAPVTELVAMARRAESLRISEFTEGLLRTIAGRGDVSGCQQVTEIFFPNGEVALGEREAAAFRWYDRMAATPGLLERLNAATATAPAGWGPWTRHMQARARPVLLDPAAPEETRRAACGVLGRLHDAATRNDLVALLNEPLPDSLHESVLEALRSFETAELVPQLLAGWATLGPRARTERLTLLLARESFQPLLLAALTRGEFSGTDLLPVQRQAWLNHPNPEFRSQAAELLPVPSADRAAVVAAYAGLESSPSTPEQGLAAFEKNCASCHRLRGLGHAVGPDLSTFRSKPVADFLQAILDPNSAIEPRYAAQLVEFADGRTLTGIITDESSASFTLRQSGGVEEVVRRPDVRRIQALAQSLMPEGLEQALPRADLAALIQWIRSTPAPFGSTGVAAGLIAQRDLVAAGVSRVRRMNFTEPPLTYASWLSPLPLRYCRQTDGRSLVRWEARAVAEAPAGRRRFRFAAATGLVSQPAGGFRLRVLELPPVTVEATTGDAHWTGGDGRVQVRYAVREQNAEDSCGVLEIDVDAAALAGADEWVSMELLGGGRSSQRWFGLYEVPGTWE